MKKVKKQNEKPFRIDFNLDTREIIEVYEISPDGREIHQRRTITQRPPHVPGFLTEDQVLFAIQVERDILKDKKYKDTAAYIVASRYPISEWLAGE
jgi:hypothetical protein